MVAISPDLIVVELKAQTDRYRRDLKMAEAQFISTTKRIRRAASTLNKQPNRKLGQEDRRAAEQGVGSTQVQAGLGGIVRVITGSIPSPLDSVKPKTFAGKFGKNVASGAASAARKSIVDSAIGDGSELTSAQRLKLQIDSLGVSVRDYAEATKQSLAPNQELVKLNGTAADELRKQLELRRAIAAREARQELERTRTQSAQRFGSFTPIDPAVLGNLNETRRDLEARSRAAISNREDRNFFSAQAGNIRDVGGVLENLQEEFDVTEERAKHLFLRLNTLAGATSAKAISQAFGQVIEAFSGIDTTREKVNQVIAEFVDNSVDASILSARAQGIAEDQSNSIADELQRAVGNSQKLKQAGLSKLQESQFNLRFADDPIGLAGELAKRQFEDETRLFEQRLELQKELIKKRDQAVILAKEEARTVLMIVEAERKAQLGTPRQPTMVTVQPPEASEGTRTVQRPPSSSSSPQQVGSLRTQKELLPEVSARADDYASATSRAQVEQSLLNDAQRSGVEITPELKSKIDQLSMAYTSAQTGANELARGQQAFQEVASQFNAIAKDALGGFINDLRNGKSAAEALEGALRKIEDRLIDIALDALFSSSGGGLFGGVLGGLSGGLLGFRNGGPVRGFASGGFVAGSGGPRSDSIPALLSNGEFVTTARATRNNRPLLEAMNAGAFSFSGLKGFADGGFVTQDLINRRIGNINGQIQRGSSPAQMPVVVPPPQINQRIINAFDEDEVVSKALDGPVGEKSLLNIVRRNPSKFRGALGV